MKHENEPVTDDEWLIRLVWFERVRLKKSPIISASSFEPRDSETAGISLYRQSCLTADTDPLAAIAADKRSKYAVSASVCGR